MNVRGRHADTAELQPVDTTAVVPYAEDVDLGDDPFADDLSERLAARAPRRYYTKATVVLAGLVLLAAGFFAGAQVEKNYGTPSSGSSSRAGNGSNLAGAAGGFGNLGGGGFAGRQGGTGQNGTGAGSTGGGSSGAGSTGGGSTGGGATGGGAAANTTTGTVKLVDGTTVYIQTPDGNVVTVKTNGSTSVQVAQNGALSDLTPGAQVTVEGSAGSDGTVTATKVTKAK